MKLLLNIFVAVAAISVPVCCHADGPMILWWQVGDEFDETTTGESLRDVMVTRGQSSVSAYDLGVNAARIRETTTDTYLMMLNPETMGDGMTMSFDYDYMYVPTVWQADISDFSAGSPEYSFVIELGSYEDATWSTLAVSEASSYGELSSAHYIVQSQGDYNPQPVAVWQPAAYSVPEPGSGTLVLVGMALLALRRRRRQHG